MNRETLIKMFAVLAIVMTMFAEGIADLIF